MDVKTTFAPDRLATDLKSLQAVDWADLWNEPIRNEVAWCLKRGWGYYSTCDRSGVMDIRLDVFSLWRLRVADGTYAKRFEHGAWRAYSEDAEAVSAAALTAWGEYLPEVTAVLGEPDTVTSWDDPALPDSERWPAWRRREHQSPYRLALWNFTDAVAELSIERGGGGTSASISGYVWQPEMS